MAGGIFGKVAADTLGLSDIGTILAPKDFDKADGDDYIMHEDGEKIYFVIKSKTDEYVFTNRGLIHVDGQSAVSKKRVVKRHEFRSENITDVTLETAGTVDLDVEIKFTMGHDVFSIDVDKKQLEQLKDLYKALFEIGKLQALNNRFIKNGMDSLNMANQLMTKNHIQADASTLVENVTNFNFNWMNSLIQNYSNKDFGEIFEKYIEN